MNDDNRQSPDHFDSAGFADLLHDAFWTVLLMLLALAIISPWWWV